MPFYQNPFDQEFIGFWTLSDFRSFSIQWKIPANVNGGEWLVAFEVEPYDFTITSDALFRMQYCTDPVHHRYFHAFNIDLTGATTAQNVVDLLNANTTFAQYWNATVKTVQEGKTVLIHALRPRTSPGFRFFIENQGAEEALRFNKRAGILEIPEYFERHRIDTFGDFVDGQGHLVLLDGTNAWDLAIIREFLKNPAWTTADLQEDWELLRGRNNFFTFKKNLYDGSLRLITVIEYPAGAIVGDLARKIEYTYTGANTVPDQETQIPYILTSGDLVTP